MHNFDCFYHCSCGAPVKWQASWEMIGAADDTEGIRIYDRESAYDVIIGYADYIEARFLMIPSFGIGIQVEDFADRNQLENRLREHGGLDRHKAVTISNAVTDYYTS